MQFGIPCIECLTKRQTKLLLQKENQAEAFRCMREMMAAFGEIPDGIGAPCVLTRFNEIYEKYYPLEDDFAQIKHRSNQMMLERLPSIRKTVLDAPDPLNLALRYARAGNYIDYEVIGKVTDEVLENRLREAAEESLPEGEYRHFLTDLGQARVLLYLADNAGEIVLDRLVVELLQQRFPRLEIRFCVRGHFISNDATRTDAEEVGLSRMVQILDNGSKVAGTQPEYAGAELKKALDEADIILSKGQGNFETLFESGYNAYYLFLCKCDWFLELFQVPRLTGMFLNEKRVYMPGKRN